MRASASALKLHSTTPVGIAISNGVYTPASTLLITLDLPWTHSLMCSNLCGHTHSGMDVLNLACFISLMRAGPHSRLKAHAHWHTQYVLHDSTLTGALGSAILISLVLSKCLYSWQQACKHDSQLQLVRYTLYYTLSHKVWRYTVNWRAKNQRANPILK